VDTKQQKEALNYFNQNANDWARSAERGSQDEVNVVKQRNDFVIKVIGEKERVDSVLDIGCGTGDLVCEIAAKGINAIGVDFAPDMINLAKDKAGKSKCGKAQFECCSAFSFPFEQDQYDVISANGFIEYISYEEFDQLLSLSWKALRRGGSLVLGSRNRLFNIFSLNEFTQDEIEEGNIAALILEAIRMAGLENVKDLIGFKTAPLQKENKEHKDTGIKVSTRYQFTPAQLVNKLKGKGFEPVEIFPIHIHGVPLRLKDKFPMVHGNISNLLQNYANNSCLISQASSFMIHCRK